MISCSNCGAENADNANHCGNCGTRLNETGAAKTMFGFSAISPEAMKKAAEEARAATDNKAAHDKAGLATPGIPQPTIPQPSNIPAPSTPTRPETAVPAPGTFNIPAPSSALDPMESAKTEMIGAIEPPVDAHAATQFGGSAIETQPAPRVEASQPAPRVEASQPAPRVEASQPTPTPTYAQPPDSPLMANPEESMTTSSRAYQVGEVRDPLKTALIYDLTCGFGGLYMTWKWSDDVNGGLGEEKYNGQMTVVLGFVTCGIYAMYQLWNMCQDVEDIQRAWGVEPEQTGPVMFLTLFFGVGPFLIQRGLNNAWENGRMPG